MNEIEGGKCSFYSNISYIYLSCYKWKNERLNLCLILSLCKTLAIKKATRNKRKSNDDREKTRLDQLLVKPSQVFYIDGR